MSSPSARHLMKADSKIQLLTTDMQANKRKIYSHFWIKQSTALLLNIKSKEIIRVKHPERTQTNLITAPKHPQATADPTQFQIMKSLRQQEVDESQMSQGSPVQLLQKIN
jgi:hypothetical protein